MSAKVMLLLFAGPEMPCKLQHAFIFARDVAQKGGEAAIVFEGNSLKWLPALAKPEHSLRKMFNTVKGEGLIVGACRGCAVAHRAVEAAELLELPLINDAFGHVSLTPFVEKGYQIVTL